MRLITPTKTKNLFAVNGKIGDSANGLWSSRKSGAYLYDFRFLNANPTKVILSTPMTPEAFADLLLATPARNEDGTLASTITAQPIKYDTLKALFSEHGASVPSEVDKDGNALS